VSAPDAAPDAAPDPAAWERVRRERDALAFLGLLARMHQQFDPPVPTGEETPTHGAGLNIHALLVDNAEGHVIGLGRNQIHATESPTQHAEQQAVRQGVDWVRANRPRAASQTVEQYYRTGMFMAPGGDAADFVRRGVTLVSTLEPCPMCATTTLVCRVKRVAFVVNDRKYGGLWPRVKQEFYANDESRYGRLDLGDPADARAGWIRRAAELYRDVVARADALRDGAPAVRDTHVFDSMAQQLAEAFEQLCRLDATQLPDPPGLGQPSPNPRTLADLQRACNIAVPAAIL
jgi:tRNA(Arg) A34 adenosine deaminase TadA